MNRIDIQRAGFPEFGNGQLSRHGVFGKFGAVHTPLQFEYSWNNSSVKEYPFYVT